MSIIEIECLIIMVMAIPLIFKFKDWWFKKQNLSIKKSEEYAFLLIMFTSLFAISYVLHEKFFMLLSFAFLYWIVYDAIKYNIQLWKEFLRIYKK